MAAGHGMKRNTLLVPVVCVGLLSVSARAALTTNSWASPASGKWEAGTNWSLALPPSTNGQSVLSITNPVSKTVTIDFATTTNNPAALTISNLLVSAPAGSTNTLLLNNAGTNQPFRVLNSATVGANGLIVVTNSVLQIAGGSFTVNGAVTNFAHGQTVATNNATTIGAPGSSGGNITALGGSLLFSNVDVADVNLPRGALAIAGGTHTLSSRLNVGAGANATGTVWMTGGLLAVTNDLTTVGTGTPSLGQLTVSNGTLLSQSIYLGFPGRGVLTVAGGTNAISGNLFLAATAFATGQVWVTDGELTATNNYTSIGQFGTGQMTVSGGTVRLLYVYVGNFPGSKGKLTIAGGTNILGWAQIPAANATGEVWISGGFVAATNAAPGFDVGDAGLGQMTVSNGICQALGIDVGGVGGSQGTLTLAGGTNYLTAPMHVGRQLNATGTVWLTGGQLIVSNSFIAVGVGGVGRMTVSNGTLMADSIIVSTNGTARGVFSVVGGNVVIGGQAVTNGFRIGDTAGTTGSVQVSDAQLVVTNTTTIIGRLGIAAMSVSNGAVVAGQTHVAFGANSVGSLTLETNAQMIVSGTLTVGSASGATGAVDVIGGQLIVTNGTFGIGNDGSLFSDGGVAHVTVSNSILEAASILVGDNTTNSASGFTLSGNGQVLVKGGLRSNGIKTTLIEGGTLEVQTGAPAFEDPALHNRISVGFQGDGRMLLSNGTVRAPEMVVGHLNGRGTFEMAGGVLNLSSNLLVGLDASATGAVFITGGTLIVTNGFFGVGNNGLGRMSISNGLVEAVSILVGDTFNGDSGLTVAGNGHVRSRGGLRSNGIKTTLVNGGTLEVVENTPPVFEDPILHNRIVIAHQADGKLVVSNGTVRAPGMIVGASAGRTGTLSIAGGVTTVYSNLIVGLVPGATGIVTITSGSLLVTNAAGNAELEVRTGTLTVSGGFVQADRLVVTNPAARLIHGGGTLIYGTLVLDPNQSAVGDGIPNGWKQQYGFDPFDPAVANADSDGDGMSNLQEFQAGTGPTSSASAFRITGIVRTNNDLRITWFTAAGKTNALQGAAGVAGDGSYGTNFTDLFVVTNTTGPVTNYLDIGVATNAATRYYRVRLVP